MDVREDLAFRKGLVTKMFLECASCDSRGVFSDPYTSSKAVNARTVLASKLCGFGCTGLDTFCQVVGLPPPLCAPPYSIHSKWLHQLSAMEAKDSYAVSCADLHHLRGADPKVIDTVTVDGTWSKRGFMEKYGVVAVLSWESGQLLDTEVLKSCPQCKAHEHLEIDSEEYRL